MYISDGIFINNYNSNLLLNSYVHFVSLVDHALFPKCFLVFGFLIVHIRYKLFKNK